MKFGCSKHDKQTFSHFATLVFSPALTVNQNQTFGSGHFLTSKITHVFNLLQQGP